MAILLPSTDITSIVIGFVIISSNTCSNPNKSPPVPEPRHSILILSLFKYPCFINVFILCLKI